MRSKLVVLTELSMTIRTRNRSCCNVIMVSHSYTYSHTLHDAHPISAICANRAGWRISVHRRPESISPSDGGARKNTRLNSSHVAISYAVFCLIKKTNKDIEQHKLTLSTYYHLKAGKSRYNITRHTTL